MFDLSSVLKFNVLEVLCNQSFEFFADADLQKLTKMMMALLSRGLA